ncbi:hypothetical protein FKM82_018819, partial [Ascaphus truei]
AEKQAPSVFPLIPDCKSLGSKTHVTIGCLATAFHPQPVNIKWNSGAITSGIKNFPAVKGQGELYTSSSQLTIPESDWCSKTFECNVEHTPSTTKVSKKIPGCKKSTPTVRVLQSSCDDNTRFNELVCLIYGHFPERIEVQWLQNGKAMSSQPNTTTQKLEEEGTFNTMSQVKILKEKWNPGANYTCSVTHPASQSQTTDSFRQCTDCKIIPKIVLLPPSPKDLFGTQTSKFTCMISRLSTAEDLSVKWSKSNGEKFNGNNSASMQEGDGTYSVNSTLQITPDAWENNDFTCSVTNRYLTTPVEEKIAKRAGTGRAPSVYILPPSVNEDPPSENKVQGFVSLTCLVKGFKPKYIEIEWFKRNKKINTDTALNEATYSNTDPTLEKDGDTYFMYSNLRIVETDWNNGSTFSCKVYHSALSRELKKEIKKSGK